MLGHFRALTRARVRSRAETCFTLSRNGVRTPKAVRVPCPRFEPLREPAQRIADRSRAGYGREERRRLDQTTVSSRPGGHGTSIRCGGPNEPTPLLSGSVRPRGRPVTPIPFILGATFRVAGPFHEAACLSPACDRSHACPPGVYGRERPSWASESRGRPVSDPRSLTSGSSEPRSPRHDPHRRVPPQGHQQLAGKGDDQHPPHPTLRPSGTHPEPPRQFALRLMPQPAPSQLNQ